MRKLIRLLAAIVLCLSISCSSMLDVEPENSVTFTNFYKNEQDIAALTRGMHAILAWSFRTFNTLEYAGVKTDASPSGHFPSPDVFMRFHLWNSVGTSWKSFYDAIYQCNLLFDNVQQPVCAQDRMDFYYGQANFIKGVCYLQLARYWGDAVISGHTEDTQARPKKPMMEVLDTALACAERAFMLLKKHEELVDYAGARITSKQYGSKGSAATLIAHIYAWKAAMGKGLSDEEVRACWEKVDTYASKVIDTDECGFYELENSAELLVANTLNTRNGKESIFEIELNAQDKTLDGTVFTSARWFVGFPVVPGALPGDINSNQWKLKIQTVLDMYPGADERKNAFFYKPELYSNDPDSARACGGYAFEYKYRKGLYSTSTTSEQTLEFVNFDVNRMVWRLADLILLRAEARMHLGNTNGAVQDLWRVQRRSKAVEYADGDLQMAIFREREKELIFEDHRYFDIMRNKGYYKTELPKNKVFVPFPFPHEEEEEVYSLLTDQEVADGALFLPIGDGAFFLNPMMIQNTYWFNRK
ncbi:RagB/SusD family nutrient uptake outer membrane protein [Butyricimonas sp. Marseille-P3923]|uniref:RagB/SusD family nutrient uptake outer membrane protein n=1 Tax=Butyricimonas sp. Marseille-P3923 TaxID=1987504 RepID=UPI000C08D082|nr:RagB/SusD family nutrient uptake outer membrane protein [Butyricimonas sp. Marseille-P3923]